MSQTWPLSRMRSQSGGETGVDTGNDNDKPGCSVLGHREAQGLWKPRGGALHTTWGQGVPWEDGEMKPGLNFEDELSGS